MFIEKLTREDIAKFLANKYSGVETKIQDYYRFDHPVAFNRYNNSLVFETEYVCYLFTDFEYASLDKNFISKNGRRFVTRFDRDWMNYLYSRFKEEYKRAFLNYRELNKQSVLNMTAESYNEETKKIEDEFVS